MLSTDKLKNKEVINIHDDFVIKWDRIRTIGDDVVLVDLDTF